MNFQYTVQTIPQNLNKEETIVQIVEVLDHLNAVTQDIFARINKRLALNSEQLSNISKRIDAASSKVERLKGDKKAKTVFSSSKYPAVDIKRDYVSIFKEPSKVERVRRQVKQTKYLSSYEPLSQLQFYHVKVPEQKRTQPPVGPGNIPSDTKCINDLLLFNSGRNVYKDFRPGDSLEGPEISNIKQHLSSSELGAAPLSISQRSSMQQAHKDTYFYTPKVEEMPALDVPWDLPDLPGVADDVRYEIDGVSSIAPSAIKNSDLADLDLPDISEINIITDDLLPSPPPPPPPQDIPEPVARVSEEVPPKADFVKIKPTEITDTIVDPVSKSLPEQELSAPSPPISLNNNPPSNDSRASLMDAIRKAGGSQKANLRRTTEQSEVGVNKNASSSGDLMADLHSKLMMRRKGISGTKKDDQGANFSTADSAFARLSSIIPPPTKNSDIGSGVSTDDEAWNDEDDT